MIVSAHQPHYLPWIGYVNKIYLSDVFMVMDNMIYTNKGFINRNRIINSKGVQYISVPLLKPNGLITKINELTIDNRAHSNWNIKHLRSIKHNYSKGLGYNFFFPLLEDVLIRKNEHFFSLQMDLIRLILYYLKIDVKIIIASETQTVGIKEKDLILNIIRDSNCNKMLLGLGASNQYVDKEFITKNGGEVIHQNFSHPVYIQRSRSFISGVSIIDLLLNVPQDDAIFFVKHSGTIIQ